MATQVLNNVHWYARTNGLDGRVLLGASFRVGPRDGTRARAMVEFDMTTLPPDATILTLDFLGTVNEVIGGGPRAGTNIHLFNGTGRTALLGPESGLNPDEFTNAGGGTAIVTANTALSTTGEKDISLGTGGLSVAQDAYSGDGVFTLGFKPVEDQFAPEEYAVLATGAQLRVTYDVPPNKAIISPTGNEMIFSSTGNPFIIR